MIKKLTILTMIVAVVAMTGMADNRNNKNKNKRRSPKIVYVEDEPKKEYVEQLTFSSLDQLYGEWDVVEVKGEKVDLPRGSRAYLFFDTKMRDDHAVNLYGNTGANSLNASFHINGSKINFGNLVTTRKMGGYLERDVERAMLDVLKKEKSIVLEIEGESEYMLLKERKNVVMKLRKQDLDFMNGSWKVMKINDKDVEKCLALLTFLPMDEVRRLGSLKDAEINEAKKVLAYEVTKLVHGEEEAIKAADASASVFGKGASAENMPTLELTADEFTQDARISTMLVRSGLCKSQSDARKQIEQKAVSINDRKITDPAATLAFDQLKESVLLKKGKKSFCRVILK